MRQSQFVCGFLLVLIAALAQSFFRVLLIGIVLMAIVLIRIVLKVSVLKTSVLMAIVLRRVC